MLNLAQLDELDFESMAQEIQELSESQSEDSLYEVIGNGLHDSGLTVATDNTFEILQPKMFDPSIHKFSLKQSVSFVANTTPLSTSNAKEEGQKFWRRFSEKLRTTICNEPKIRKLLTGEGELKDYLRAGIPLVLAALGFGALNPLLLAIIASVFALIVKVGFKTYCDIA